ncbi:hypothetical protein VA596_48090 [Amycolatopsis sp., V23-08]|uniref:Tat pathway signal sequence domain protein n=1 Tax=Amycolatopsis heterodermiae TaxID=3110235 RepID=A0ABU5RNS7_9PSEU|nr:hypothetical protein [Amycolatopsis sp., V23-08]MEA5367364.1 hypothetical protein [Amycolatopsis sp., V23-08]
MTDLDEVRRVLRAQESLAPDPDDVLAVATRRIRRRRTTSVAAVTLAVAALGAGAVGVLDRGTAAQPPAALGSSPAAPPAPAAGQVPPAAPAVSLEDKSWDLTLWAIQPRFASLHYAQDRRYAFEIDVHDGAAPRSALPAKPSSAGQLTHPQSVMWQDGPDRWFRVTTTKPVTAAEMLALLGKIGTTPPVVASPLKSVQVPGGQKVAAFTSEPEANTLVLCPDLKANMAPLDTRCFSLFVSLTRGGDGTGSASPEDPLPVHQNRTLGAYTIEVDSAHGNEAAALVLLNSVRLNR